MFKLSLYLVSLLVFVSCTSEPQPVEAEVPAKDTSVVESPRTIEELQAYAIAILSDSIEPGDNSMSLRCLDSLLSENPDTRAFYFDVYLVMANKSDGALSELVTAAGVDYLAKYPNEMLLKYELASQEDKELIADNLAFEFYASGGTIAEEVGEFFRKINKQVKPAQQKLAGSLKKAIISRAKEMRSAENEY